MDVHFFAAARAAAGTSQTTINPDQLSQPTLGALMKVLGEEFEGKNTGAMGLADVLTRCSFLIDGVSTTDAEASVQGAQRVDVLPPFAGG